MKQVPTTLRANPRTPLQETAVHPFQPPVRAAATVDAERAAAPARREDLLLEAEAQRALAELFPHLKLDALRAIQDLFPLQAQSQQPPAPHQELRFH